MTQSTASLRGTWRNSPERFLTGLCLDWDAVGKIKLKSSRNSWVAFSIPLSKYDL